MIDPSPDNELGLNDPSVFEISDADRMKYPFSDVSILESSEIHFVARAVRCGKWFALKGLAPGYRTDAGAEAMLRKEFELLVELQHPNIRRALSFEESPEFGPCIIMDYVEGPNLRDWLSSSHPLKERVRVAEEIANALSYIHGKGIVHRDIKPENIIVSRIGDIPVLIDFGLSDSDKFAILKGPGGTETYLSPEQKVSSVPHPKNDIYSLGILLKELLPERRFAPIASRCTGPFEKRPENAREIIRKLKASYRRPAALTVFLIFTVVIGVIFIIALRPEEKSVSQTPIPATSEISAPAHISDETIPTDNVASSTPVNITEPVQNVSQQQEHALPEKDISSEKDISATKTVTPQEKTYTSAALSHEKAFNEIVTLGYKTIDLSIAEEFDKLKDHDLNPAMLPENLDARQLSMIKDNFLRSIGINIKSNGSFTEKYPLKTEDITLMDKMLNNHIQQCQQKWKELRTQKISNP